MYKCGWQGCEKAYGTLNHLNAHVTMQGHGQKRTPEGMVLLPPPFIPLNPQCNGPASVSSWPPRSADGTVADAPSLVQSSKKSARSGRHARRKRTPLARPKRSANDTQPLAALRLAQPIHKLPRTSRSLPPSMRLRDPFSYRHSDTRLRSLPGGRRPASSHR